MARTILEPITVGTAPQTFDETALGTSYATVGDAYYDMGGVSEFVSFLTIHQAPDGTSPTLDVRIEHSPDKTNWATSIDFAQITTSGTTAKELPAAGTTSATPKTFARYIRFRAKVGGTSPVFSGTLQISPKE